MTSAITEKRLINELKDLKKNKLEFAQAIQDETNKFIFYFLLVGDKEDPKSKEKTGHYEGGYYIGKIMLPSNYPEKPGDFMMLTPNGRFEIQKKICLTNSGYHSESWTPIWSIRNMILGFASIFYVDLDTGISHIKKSKAERREMAKQSIKYNMDNYKDIFVRFDQFINEDGTIKPKANSETDNDEANKIAAEKAAAEKIAAEKLAAEKAAIEKAEKEKAELMEQMMIEEAINKSKQDAKAKQDQEALEIELALKEIAMLEENENAKKVAEKAAYEQFEKDLYVEEDDVNSIYNANNKHSTVVNVLDEVEAPKKKEKANKKIKVKKSDKSDKSNNGKLQLVNDKLEIIKNMTRKTFDVAVFNDVQKLIEPKYND